MTKTILDLQMMLNCEHFIVTGSYALSQYGLVPQGKVKDLDIILVNPTNSTLELVASLMEKSPAKTKPIPTNVETITTGCKCDHSEETPIPPRKKQRPEPEEDFEETDFGPTKKSFASGGIISKPTLAMVGTPHKLGLIAIFKWNDIKVDIFVKKEEPFATINGIKYASIPRIVEAKKSCNRIKDWIQLRAISKFFFHKDLWEKFLDTNPEVKNTQEDYPFL